MPFSFKKAPGARYGPGPPIELALIFEGASFGAIKIFLGKFFGGGFSGNAPEINILDRIDRVFES